MYIHDVLILFVLFIGDFFGGGGVVSLLEIRARYKYTFQKYLTVSLLTKMFYYKQNLTHTCMAEFVSSCNRKYSMIKRQY